MAKINPNDSKWDDGGGGERTPQCGVGDKLLAAVGFERYKASTGTKMLGVRFLCLSDMAGSGDEGSICFENFALTEKALWRMVDYARAVGYNEPFDPENDEDIGALLTAGYCIGHLAEETYKGKTSVRISGEGDTPAFRKTGSYDEDPGWSAMIEAAEDNHRDYLDWRAKNPRGGGSSGKGYSGGTGGGQRLDDDIPFARCCDGEPEWVNRLLAGVSVPSVGRY